MKALGVLFLAFHQAAATADGDAIGRLFFTPEQRLLLDRQRRLGISEEIESAAIRLDGVAMRAGRKPTVWVNGRSLDSGRDEMAASQTPLRVGESLDPVTQQKMDVVPDGSVTRSKSRHTR